MSSREAVPFSWGEAFEVTKPASDYAVEHQIDRDLLGASTTQQQRQQQHTGGRQKQRAQVEESLMQHGQHGGVDECPVRKERVNQTGLMQLQM
jgi:hypothetical protein